MEQTIKIKITEFIPKVNMKTGEILGETEVIENVLQFSSQEVYGKQPFQLLLKHAWNDKLYVYGTKIPVCEMMDNGGINLFQKLNDAVVIKRGQKEKVAFAITDHAGYFEIEYFE